MRLQALSRFFSSVPRKIAKRVYLTLESAEIDKRTDKR